MQNRGTLIAFLAMCFALTGLVGLFASYSAGIPLERAMHQLATLDAAGPADRALHDAMGKEADPILASPGDDQAHLARARVAIRDEAAQQAGSVGKRTRWMIFIVTFLSAAIGAGLLMLASRPPDR